MPAELDAIDMKILELMQRDASLSTAELAERVGLSQSPCWRRIQRMREEGYIKAQVVIVDREKLGFKMQIFAQVKMTTLSDEDRAKFHKAINDIPEILECYTVFGEMDAMLKILAPDVIWYQDFIFSTIGLFSNWSFWLLPPLAPGAKKSNIARWGSSVRKPW